MVSHFGTLLHSRPCLCLSPVSLHCCLIFCAPPTTLYLEESLWLKAWGGNSLISSPPTPNLQYYTSSLICFKPYLALLPHLVPSHSPPCPPPPPLSPPPPPSCLLPLMSCSISPSPPLPSHCQS